MTKKRIINIRVTFVAFIGLMLGILFCRNYLLNKFSNIAIFFILFFLLGGCALSIFYACKTNKFNLMTEFRKKVSVLIKVSSISFVIAFLVGIILTIYPYFKIYALPDFDDEVYVVGQVCDYVEDGGTYTKFLIKNVTIEDNENIYKTDFKVLIYTTKSSSIELGGNIEFFAELNKYSLNNSSEANKLYQNIALQTYVDFQDISIGSGNMLVKDYVKNSTKNILQKNLNFDNANICFAILFGEKQGLNDNIQEMFSYAGISHILAVSGLHIGVLVGLLVFILEKIKMNKYVRVGVLSGILLFYSYLCSFTPSVCRASIMAMLLSICKLLKVEYDALSSMSIAGIIILLFNPFALFSVSFQLSFLCIFSIISLSPTFEKFLTRIKFPKFLASSLALSIATNIAILPILYNVFYKVSILGILANIFVLPIFSITYVLLFLIVVVSLIFKFLGFLLFIPNLFLQLIKVIANYISSIPFGIFKVLNISYWSLVLIILSAITIHFLMVKKLIKSTLSFTLVGIVFVFFICNTIPKVYDEKCFVFVSKYNSNAVYYINNNEVTLVGSDIYSNIVLKELKSLRIKKITNIVAYDFQLNQIDDFLEICKDNNVENIYLPKSFEYDGLEDILGCVTYFNNTLNINDLTLNTIEYKSEIVAVKLTSTFMGNILIPSSDANRVECEFINQKVYDIDLIYLNKYNTYLDYNLIKPNCVIINNDKVYFDLNEYEEFDTYFYY